MIADAGKKIAERFKIDLPKYGEFDEKRRVPTGTRDPGPGRAARRAYTRFFRVCEDIWGRISASARRSRKAAPSCCWYQNGSPYYRGKGRGAPAGRRAPGRRERPADPLTPTSWAARDELGLRRRLLRAAGRPHFGVPGTAIRGRRLHSPAGSSRAKIWRCLEGQTSPIPHTDEADYSACMLGLRDYVDKNGFQGNGRAGAYPPASIPRSAQHPCRSTRWGIGPGSGARSWMPYTRYHLSGTR